MRGVKYVAPVFDSSGYASASRNYIFSLYKKGIPICVEPHCFEANQNSIGTEEERRVLAELIATPIPYDIVICQLTPDMALLHREAGKYNIAYFAWETSKVHPKWVDCINQMNEVWVPCEWNVAALKSSGVNIPIRKIPHSIDTELFESIVEAEPTISIPLTSTYIFYSIFQWQPRKNPEALLRSYLNAFSNDEDVILLVKTYIRDGAPAEREYISETVRKIKMDMGFASYPKMMFLFDMMSDEQMRFLHKRADCFVGLSHSEGWGLTPFEAGLAGNPVIATDAGGHREFLNSENSFPVKSQWAYVRGMSVFNHWYLGSGLWADPDEVHATELMRYVFENKLAAKEKGSKLQKDITEKFSLDKVSDIMIRRLSNISI
jgi:glycosyltransferase involved in cell wall biosynthesis